MKLWRKPLNSSRPPGALASISVDKERCKGCGFCVEFCHQKVLKLSSELGPKGYQSVIVDDSNECLNCGFCEAICPEFAIKLSPLETTQSVGQA
jgi:2-oxoglutarate ferredoxin oxidoreductase subunit delta